MTNLLIAYSVVFLIIFVFAWLLTSRQKRLEKKLEQLQQLLKDKR
jgi:CcmD family protein